MNLPSQITMEDKLCHLTILLLYLLLYLIITLFYFIRYRKMNLSQISLQIIIIYKIKNYFTFNGNLLTNKKIVSRT